MIFKIKIVASDVDSNINLNAKNKVRKNQASLNYQI
jgi:hypothetical protein